ncbi:MAG TPA: urocanate hydratase [Bdellovibrionota bacterium]|nr:urocanate hydratase [Bdellovibrionota bacterium]
MKRTVRAPRGSEKVCKTWAAEAAYRMIQNNLDPEVAENPDELVVYGGIGKAARNWESFDAILECLKRLEPNETLLVQSGKPVGVLPSHPDAPRVLLANSNLVPRWATWDHFHELDKKGLMMYGQMTAGSWIYIGTQGILQGTYETFAACGRQHFAGEKGYNEELPLKHRTVVSGGLGGMGGAQPLAAKLAGASCLMIEVDETRIDRRIQEAYLDVKASSLGEAIRLLKENAERGNPISIGLCMHAGEALRRMLELNFVPDVLSDQTSAHDPLNGYVPDSLSVREASAMRTREPKAYEKLSLAAMAEHVRAMRELQKRGAITFDYGNNIRAMAETQGVQDAFEIPGFVPEYIRPMFCEGNGPFRWVALSGDPEDIAVTDRALLELFPENKTLRNWLQNGAPKVKFQGLPSRICWLRHGERERAGLLLNQLVASGKVKAPIVIGRDHLDCGSVASPNRETERMLDGSDAVSDWPLLNAMINAVNGASWVSLHHGGGVGMGYSQHSGMVIVADGTTDAERRLKRVLNSDPSMGILRHADAGYPIAQQWARDHAVKIPMAKATP